MLLGTLGASLLRKILTRIERLRTGCGNKEGAGYRSERSAMKRSVKKNV